MEKMLWKHIETVRRQSPLVHNITNYVVMNSTANALLAAGASPIMSHAHAEVKQMVALSHALVINIGTLDEYWVDAMLLAAETAQQLGKPWVLDPVGAGATSYRDEVLQRLMAFKPTVIRGNASEIMALAKFNGAKTKGVDSTAASLDAVTAAISLLEQQGAVICISGATDIIVDQEFGIHIHNGHPLMTKVTGLGCTASALIGAFIGVVENKTEATSAAMSLLGIAGELAQKEADGPGSLQVKILDQLYNMQEEIFLQQLNISLL
ncbi:hydroxyethylthiazole kinase [Flavihumibacter sp. CACIAM 22H1]|uniref:hydroxyethylthiazole kinase n=1 Tax=Flavihumibacter sp. CACIAM 22H1 TaxID=1812911 RepID=UPI000AD9CECB|nr:hydroxyethylthiazole kinase [Flavihumibacter sp. CACIAM 22H1]